MRQLYPTFTQQATELSGTSARVELRSQAGTGRSSLVSLNLRVGSSWATNIAINNDLVRDHRWNDLDNDDGIAAVIDLVRPLDWGAEVATDRVQSATPVIYASSLSHDPSQMGTGYSCTDANHTFTSSVPMLGASCFVTQANLRPAGTASGASRISEQKHTDAPRQQGHAPQRDASHDPNHDQNRDRRHDARPSEGSSGGSPPSQASGRPQGKPPTDRE